MRGRHRLAHQRESQTGAVALRREIGLEHPLAELLRNPRPVISDGHRQPRAVAAHPDVDRTPSPHRFGRVAQQVGEGVPQRIVVPEQLARLTVGVHGDRDLGGHRALAQIRQEVNEVHFALGALRQAAEFRELLRELVESLCFGGEYVYCHCGPPVRLSDCSTDLVHRDSHRRQRILDLVRHATRHLPERTQPLRLELALPRVVERRCQLAQRLTQCLELRRAATRRGPPSSPPSRRRQRHAAPNEPGPPPQLVDRAGELAREMPGQPYCGEHGQGAGYDHHNRESGRVVAQVRLCAARQGHRARELFQVPPQRRALARREVRRIHTLQHLPRRPRHLLEGDACPGRRRDRAHGERPADDGQGRGHGGQCH